MQEFLEDVFLGEELQGHGVSYKIIPNCCPKWLFQTTPYWGGGLLCASLCDGLVPSKIQSYLSPHSALLAYVLMGRVTQSSHLPDK